MIMKRLLTFLCFLFSLSLFGQNQEATQINPLQAVQASKSAGKIFENITLVKSERQDISKLKPGLEKELTDYQVLEVPAKTVKNLNPKSTPQLSLKIPLYDEQEIEIELVEVKILADDFVVRTSSSQGPQEVEIGTFYRGVIKGEKGSLASLSIQNGRLTGMFSSPVTGNWVMGEIEGNKDRYILYRDEDKINPSIFHCDTKDNGLTYSVEEVTTSAFNSGAKCTQIYFEVDNDIYRDKGGTSQTVNYITAIFNEVAILYANEDLKIEISEIFVWDSTSPYTGSSSSALLNQFQQRRTSFNGDLAQLLSYKASGGIAVLDGLCHPYTSAKMSFSSIGTSFRNVPDYSFTVMVVAHELGHLFGSHHTHACVWNGNGTAIDACAGFVEGNCGSAAIPQGGGTIMSYCHLQRTGINFTKGFGSQPGNVIRNNVANASCVQTCTGSDGNDNPDPVDNDGCDGTVLTVTITLDDYPTENSWKITGDNNVVLYSGGPYQKGAGGSKETIDVCLPDGCYFFEISDEYGDGMCCRYGQGGYKIEDADGNSIISGSEFGFSEVKEFCVDQSGAQGDNGNDCLTLNFNDYDVISYGGPQDVGTADIQNNGEVLEISLNAWKAIPFKYQVTPQTILQFDFASTREGEIHAIGMDDNTTISSSKTFKLHGFQSWGLGEYDNYPNNGRWKTYKIPVGNYFTGPYTHIFFVADHDSGSGDGNSRFRNVIVYESGECSFTPDEDGFVNTLNPNQAKTTAENYIDLSLYPNPATNDFVIEMKSINSSSTTIEIFNSIGQLINTVDWSLSKGLNQKLINTMDYPEGTYLLRLENDGEKLTKRFNVLR